jgi:hypothetical protein
VSFNPVGGVVLEMQLLFVVSFVVVPSKISLMVVLMGADSPC